jgi:hypothetical protein
MRFLLFAAFFAGLILLSKCAGAAEVDVDMPPSDNPKYQLIRVTIDGCETFFKVKTKDFESLSNNNSAIQDLVDKALKHAQSGCTL